MNVSQERRVYAKSYIKEKKMQFEKHSLGKVGNIFFKLVFLLVVAFTSISFGGTYAIITTEEILNASLKLNESDPNNFISHKENMGFDVLVVTEDDFGGGIGDTAAENIRIWLQNNYESTDMEYVLLIGNPHPEEGMVPMKNIGDPASNNYCSSDVYYSELTLNFNLDGDGYYGETVDDMKYGHVEICANVAVGRIPYYDSIDDLDQILSRSILYELATPAAEWLRNALLAMTRIDENSLSYPVGEAIKESILIPNEWSYHRIYDIDCNVVPPPETLSSTTHMQDAIDVWNGTADNSDGKFGLVVWSSHGGSTQSAFMEISHVQDLDDRYPSFTF